MKKRRAPARPRSTPAAERAPAAAAARTPAAERAPTYDDILAIARLIESGSRFTEFRLRSGDIEVEVKRGNGGVAPAQAGAQGAGATAELGPRTIAGTPASGATQGFVAAQQSVVAPAQQVAAAPAQPASAMPDLPAGTHVIQSPMVGTFYRSPEPGAPPFVEIGQRVQPDTIVCIIEVMKLMNSVAAGVHGTVTHVFAENAQPVDIGQPLVAIRPGK